MVHFFIFSFIFPFVASLAGKSWEIALSTEAINVDKIGLYIRFIIYFQALKI